MNKLLKIVIAIGFVVLFQQHIYAQTQNNKKFLQKVGILDSLHSRILNETRKIYVQLPSDYNPEKNRKYPVVYILDGEIFLPTVNDVLYYYSGGYMPEMVLVGISNEKNRTRDLTTSTITTKYGMPFKAKNGQADNFRKFIEKELFPYVESKYPVTNYRTLIGHSYGGLFTIYTLLNYPEMFTNYLAIDPSLDWDNQKLLKQAKILLNAHNYKNKSLFMSLSGQLDMQNSGITLENVMKDTTDYTLFARSNIAFANIVKENAKNGLSFKWKFYPRDIHGTVSFPSIMDGMIWLFKWFQMENTAKFNSFDTPKNELLSIIRHREKKLREHFGYAVPPYPEELLNMLGYMNLQQPEKAKMYFELAIEYYPKSVNAYDSMGEFYEKHGEYAKAIKYLTKAFELSGNDLYKKRIESLKAEMNKK